MRYWQLKESLGSQEGGRVKPIGYDKFINNVKQNCSQIIKPYWDEYRRNKLDDGARYLFRGIMEKGGPHYYGTFPTDRKPLSSDRPIYEFIDSMLEKNGFKARKKNSISTTVEEEQAKDYGWPYLIFPSDGFHFTYSPKRPDLILTDMSFFRLVNDVEPGLLDKFQNETRKSFNELLDDYIDDNLEQKIFQEWVENINLQSGQGQQIEQALEDAKGEIMVTGDHYYGISLDHVDGMMWEDLLA